MYFVSSGQRLPWGSRTTLASSTPAGIVGPNVEFQDRVT